MFSQDDHPEAALGTFAEHALTLYDSGLGEVFPIRPDTKKPVAWDKPADDWEWDEREPDGKHHTVTARNHPTITREHVERWVEEYPDHMIGLVPAPGVVVVDIDQHHDKHGAQNLATTLGKSRPELGMLLKGTLHSSAREAGKGWTPAHGHWVYTVPEGSLLKRNPVPDVEVVGPGRAGYYVVAPGSVHPETGRVYTVDVSGVEVPIERLTLSAVRPMPAPLLDLLRDDEEHRERPTGGGLVEEAEPYANDPWGEPDEAVRGVLDEYEADLGEYAGEGTHHGSALRVQIDLVHLAEEGHAGVWTALSEAESLYKGYRDDGDWERQIAGVSVDIERMKYGQENGDWSYAPKVTVLQFPDGTPVPARTREQARADSEDRFWNSRPVLRRMRDFARARRVAPWALLGCVLARVGASVPVEVVLPPLVGSDGSLNSFFALCGNSGAGKSAAMSAAEDFLEVVGGIDYEKTGVGSGEGLIASYVHAEGGRKDPETGEKTPVRMVQHNDSTVYFVDEVQALGALGQRTASTLIPFLKQAWVGAMLATQNASRETNRKVAAYAYRLNVVAGVQPEHAEVILADVGGGFPQRWMWLPTYDPGRLARGTVAEEVEPWVWHVPDPDAADSKTDKPLVTPGGRYRMSVPEVVRDAVDEAQEANNRPIGEKAVGDTLDGHAVFAREKVAALLALLDGRLAVSTKDWTLSGYVAAKSEETRSLVMRAHAQEAAREFDKRAARVGRSASIAKESEFESDIVRVMKSLRSKLEKAKGSGDGWMSGSPLKKTLAPKDRKDIFGAAIERLLESGEVEQHEVEHRGQTGTQYRIRV